MPVRFCIPRYLLQFLLVLIIPRVDFAQSQELDKYFQMSLEELMNVKVVAASRSERRIRDLPSTIHVITREEILNNHYNTLVDALKDLPGIKVSQPGTGTHGEKYLIRGLWGNNYAKILIDGIPIRPSAVDGMPIGEQINMRNVDRIEVVYGPASALYGADALGGIINIITLHPNSDHVFIEGSIGESGYASSHFHMTRVNEGIRINIYGGYSKRDDMNIVKSADAFSAFNLDGDPVIIGRLPNKSHNVGVDLLYRDFHFQYNLMYRSDPSSLEQDSRYYIWDNPKLIYGETIQRSSLSHRIDTRKLIIKSFVTYIRYRLDPQSAFGMIFYPNPLYKFTASDDIILEENLIYMPVENLEIGGGISYQLSGAMPKTNDLIKPFDENFYHPFSLDIPARGVYQSQLLGDFGFNPIKYNNFGTYLQASYSGKKVTAVFGIRYDDHSEYGNNWNPRAALMYRFLENTYFRVSFSEAFRAPPPYKVYNSIAVDNGDGSIFYLNIPNKNLKPEAFRSYEMAFRHIFNKNISIEIIGYHNKISGLITSGTFPLDPAIYPHSTQTHANADQNSPQAQSVLRSIEFIGHFKELFKPLNIGSHFYFSYMNGNETLPTGEEIELFRNTPEFLIKWRLNAWIQKKFYIQLDQTYSSRWYARVYEKAHLLIPDRRSDAYYTLDAVMNYTWKTAWGQMRAFVRVDNVTNQRFGGFKYVDNPQYMRTFSGGLSLSY